MPPVFAATHAWQRPPQAVLQQTPSAQNPLAHSVPRPDGVPLPTEYSSVAPPMLGTVSINPGVFAANMRVKPDRDLSPVTVCAETPSILITRRDFPASNVSELIAYVKANPGKVAFASPGSSTLNRLEMEIFKKDAGLDMVHVPYKGGAGPAVTDVLGGHVDLMFTTMSSALQFVKDNQVKALAVTTRERIADLPDVPTMYELGWKNLVTTSWQGVMVPTGTPRPIVEKLRAAIVRVLADPQIAGAHAKRRRSRRQQQISGGLQDLHRRRNGEVVQGHRRKRRARGLTHQGELNVGSWSHRRGGSGCAGDLHRNHRGGNRAETRLRIFQKPRRAGVSDQKAGPCPLLRLSCREQQRIPSGEAFARRGWLDRGTIAPQLRDRLDTRQSRGSRYKPAAAASPCPRRRRRRVSLRRTAVRLEARSSLAHAGGLGQWSDARFSEEIAAPGPSGMISVLMRLGTSPTGTTAISFIDAVSIAETERRPALEM